MPGPCGRKTQKHRQNTGIIAIKPDLSMVCVGLREISPPVIRPRPSLLSSCLLISSYRHGIPRFPRHTHSHLQRIGPVVISGFSDCIRPIFFFTRLSPLLPVYSLVAAFLYFKFLLHKTCNAVFHRRMGHEEFGHIRAGQRRNDEHIRLRIRHRQRYPAAAVFELLQRTCQRTA
jgi:hypothetical protein